MLPVGESHSTPPYWDVFFPMDRSKKFSNWLKKKTPTRWFNTCPFDSIVGGHLTFEFGSLVSSEPVRIILDVFGWKLKWVVLCDKSCGQKSLFVYTLAIFLPFLPFSWFSGKWSWLKQVNPFPTSIMRGRVLLLPQPYSIDTRTLLVEQWSQNAN